MGKRWRKRAGKPRRRIMRRNLGIASRTHLIKRLAEPVFIQNGNTNPIMSHNGNGSFYFGSPVGGTLPNTWEFGMSSSFQLNSVIDYTDITQLFDRYKITGIALKLHYLASGGLATGAVSLPTVHYAYDFDDADIPGTLQTVITKAYCKTRVLNANRPTKIYLKPRLSKEIFNSPVSTGYSSEKPCWLDCNSAGVPHYGVKFWITEWNGGVDNNNALRIQPIYYLALKDTQ